MWDFNFMEDFVACVTGEAEKQTPDDMQECADRLEKFLKDLRAYRKSMPGGEGFIALDRDLEGLECDVLEALNQLKDNIDYERDRIREEGDDGYADWRRDNPYLNCGEGR